MNVTKSSFWKKYIGRYTVVFAVFCAVSLVQFLLSGVSLIWQTDGASQYYPYLHYFGNYLRDTLEGFLFHGQKALGMYDFSIGMGDDLGAILRSHPLDFLAAVVPGRYTELLYQFLILLRMYLAGLSFSAFCFYWGKREQAVLMGSMVYIFSGYVFIFGLRHPTFNAPMIILPLLLVGADLVIRGKNGLLFSFMTGLGFISNYYFMYMCSFAMAAYVVLRFFGVYKEKRVKNFFLMGIRLVAYYLLGMGTIMVVLLPTVLRLTTSARLSTTYDGGFLTYKNMERYYKWFINLIAPLRGTGSSTSLNYAVLVLPAATLLFAGKWKKHLSVKIALVLETAGILIPACGYLMSGFSNVNNRWIFIFSMTLAFVCVIMADEFAVMTKGQIKGLILITVFYCGLIFVFPEEDENQIYWMIGAVELVLCTALILFLRLRKVSRKVWDRALIGIVCVSCFVNGFYTFDEQYGNVLSEYMLQGETEGYLTENRFGRIAKIEDEGFYRVDTNTMASGKENASLMLDYNGISMYNSIVNSNIIQYLLDQESPGVNAVHRLHSMDGRAACEALANVKYYMTSADETGDVPYGFEKNQEFSGTEYAVYENQYPLAFGYTYDQFISQEAYEQLTPLEKQQIMLEAVVVPEEADIVSLESLEECNDEILTVPLKVSAESDTIKKVKNGYQAKEGSGSFSFTYEKKAGYEAYLHLKGFYMDVDASGVNIITPNMEKSVTLRSKDSTYTLGRENYLVNLGYSEEDGTEEIQIRLNSGKKFRLDAVEICYVSMENHAEDIAGLNEQSLRNLEMGVNTVSGTVNLTEDRFLVFSIPYSDGWTAYVDGVKTELTKANVMYMGISLEEGEREIRLEYCTPGLKVGAIITVVSDILFVVLLIFWRKKRRTVSATVQVQ